MFALKLALALAASLPRSVLSDAVVDEARQPGLVSTALPSHLSDVSAVLVNRNVAVIPGDWDSGDISKFSDRSHNDARY